MRFFLLFLLISITASHASDPLDHKKGFVLGAGFVATRYTFPADFNGVKNEDLDEKATLFGGGLLLGYDVVLFQRILLGIHGEGMVADTMGMGNKEDNRLVGKMRATNALFRLGGLFQMKAFDMVGDPTPMTIEIFAEGGITSGHRSMSKKFVPDSTDTYIDNLEEEYQGNILAGGINLTTPGGAFLELKASQTSMNNTRQKFTGRTVENGVARSLERTLDDKKSFTTFLVMFGHHY